MDRKGAAISCFRQGFSCAQAVFSTFAPELGLQRETALRVAGAYGGGMARMGETCGAVTGAFMVIGLKYGNVIAEDLATRDKTYALAQEFARRFKEQRGSIACKILLNHDISILAELQAAQALGLFDTICPVLVGESATILAELLA